MNKTTTHPMLDIDEPGWPTDSRVAWAVGFVGLGIILWLQMKSPWSAPDEDIQFIIYAIFSFGIAAVLPYSERTYLDFTGRQIVVLKRYAWFETSRRCRPLTDFGNIVVRHRCYSGEGPDTYTASVGLKPVDGQPVIWVKGFPATEDEVPRAAYEFASELQELTGLPCASGVI